ncbi:prolyl oligopeptidase family serine peptidase, partial [candidate division KSB1 bacterium]|nr:prolyl oligopeptidase family serine peptidase [candidate division KSB1 bacterium]
RVYIFNYDTFSWELVGTHSSSPSDGLIDSPPTGEVEDYISPAGFIYVKVISDESRLANDFTAIRLTLAEPGQDANACLSADSFSRVNQAGNATILDDDGKIKAQNFKVLAEHLSSNGFAVLRYNKRYVSNYSDYDEEKYRTLRGPMLLADVKSVLAEMRAHALVDSNRIFIYAASQGTRIVPTLAVSDPSIKGLILQGPVIHHFRTQHRAEFLPNVIIPYLKEYCGEDEIDAACLLNARQGSCGGMVRAFLGFFADFEAESTPVINQELDLNSDGRIGFANEIQIALENIRTDASRPYALKTISELVSDLKTPLLILQGESDAVISVAMVESLVDALDESGHQDHALKIYPKLGHTLGYAETRIADDMREIASEPLEDLTAWLNDRT